MVNPRPAAPHVSDDDFVPPTDPHPLAGLAGLFGALLRQWWVIVLSVALCVAIAIGVAYALPEVYRAEALLQPADQETTTPLVGLAAQFGVGLRGNSSAAEAQAVLESKAFTIEFIRRRKLLPILFAQDWDPVGRRWTVTESRRIPTELDGYRMFRDSIREVSRDRQTGQVLLAITWTDPKLAAAWANGMVTMLNVTVRERAQREAAESLSYLRTAYRQATLVEMRASVLALMTNELNKSMLATVRNEYAFRVLDPAVVPNRRSSPNRVLIAAAGLALGAALGVVLALLRDYLRRRPRPPA